MREDCIGGEEHQGATAGGIHALPDRLHQIGEVRLVGLRGRQGGVDGGEEHQALLIVEGRGVDPLEVGPLFGVRQAHPPRPESKLIPEVQRRRGADHRLKLGEEGLGEDRGDGEGGDAHLDADLRSGALGIEPVDLIAPTFKVTEALQHRCHRVDAVAPHLQLVGAALQLGGDLHTLHQQVDPRLEAGGGLDDRP